MTKLAPSVLLSSAGRRGELVSILKEAVSIVHGPEAQVHAADRSPLTSAGWLSDRLVLVPGIRDDHFIDSVLSHCVAHGIEHVIPTIDTELAVYAAAKERFAAAGVTIWVSSPESIAITQDKRRTNLWLSSLGLPTPIQLDLADALSFADISFPLIAKPAQGSSSIGLRTVHTHDELKTLDPTLDYVVETIASGTEHTVDVLVDDEGVCRVAVPRRRLETRAGEVSKGLTVADEALQDLATRVVQALPSAFGVLNVQIFKDFNTGAMSVIEINARFGGGFPLTWAAGAQVPTWLFQKLAGVEPTASLVWRPDTLMLRYDAAKYLNAAAEGISL